MKTTKIKSGTKEEIIKYMRSKSKKMIMDVTTEEKWSPWKCKKREFYELESNTIEHQIDSFVQSGSPVVVVSLAGHGGSGFYREQFLLTDFGEIKIDMELKKADNMELRDKRLTQIKILINMEMNAEERWNRILEIIDDYKGVSIPFEL